MNSREDKRSDPDDLSVGALLRALRLERGLPLREVERRLGREHGYYGLVERGQRPTPELSLVARAAEVLGNDPQLLLAITLQHRVREEFSRYRALRVGLPELAATIYLPADAAERFRDGSRTADALSSHYRVSRGPDWHVDVRDHRDEIRLRWDVTSVGPDDDRVRERPARER